MSAAVGNCLKANIKDQRIKLFGNFEEQRSGSVDKAKIIQQELYKRDPKHGFNNTLQNNRRLTQIFDNTKNDVQEFNNVEVVHSARSTTGLRKDSQEPQFSQYFVNMLRPQQLQ